ncbi:PREDICTED: uncharacterized protein LOC107104494 [Cyprinodon variegatus]|uniref:uncharacterized protein LOC107104494 n=1 Tax=Cyprinodon variegatus TaxID=28743 RepID=UPI000742A66E|nr:PREDICTED: uncharacterized protein LOC107104494 [Cyprinodon variegatus]
MNPLLTASLWALLSAACFFQAASTDQRTIKITAELGKNIILPCRAHGNRSIIAVEWSRVDLGSEYILVYKHDRIDPQSQRCYFKNGVALQERKITDGDVSLVLKNVRTDDRGTYQCRIAKEKLVHTVQLDVAPPPPDLFASWAVALLVFLGLSSIALLLYHFRHYYLSEYRVVADSKEESILLPCKTRPLLPADARVEWIDGSNTKVHVYENGSDQLEEQYCLYRTRTKMNKDPLRTGDLSLTLKHPTDGDSWTYSCSVYSREGSILMEKQIHLHVKVHQVVVKEGAEYVQLPFITTPDLPGDAEVIWLDKESRIAHVYKNGSDQPGEQHDFYRKRNKTKMNNDPLRTGDLSLTLKRPTMRDCGEYGCSVTKDLYILRVKKVQLIVKAGTAQSRTNQRTSGPEASPLIDVI